jgi:uncharacterized membrane protein YsdA (DUF1294 family)
VQVPLIYIILSDFISQRTLGEWLLLWFCLGVAGMGWDRFSAGQGLERISERAFYVVALMGGFLGVFVGGQVFHHKTTKGYFWVIVAIASIPPVVFLILYSFPWLVSF